MTSIISKNVQKLGRWWVLDAKNGGRSPEEVSEYETLTDQLIADCQLQNKGSLRKVAAKVAAERLKQAM